MFLFTNYIIISRDCFHAKDHVHFTQRIIGNIQREPDYRDERGENIRRKLKLACHVFLYDVMHFIIYIFLFFIIHIHSIYDIRLF